MSNLRIIAKIIDVLKHVLTIALFMCPVFFVTNLVEWTDLPYWLIFSPVILLLGFPVMVWLVGFFVLLWRNLKVFWFGYYIRRQLRIQEKERKKVEEELNRLKRRI
jgi:type VI protein secretion system component VasK